MPHVYCIEGHWGYDWGEPSVEPMLDMVRSVGGWPYIRRNSATVGEMHYWLRKEWWKLEPGSILYIASHGAPGEIWLTNADEYREREGETLGSLAARLEDLPFAKNCLLHFSGCRVLETVSDPDLDELIERSGASAVSGFRNDAGWLVKHRDRHGVIPPSVALEAMYFSSIMERAIRLHLLRGHADAATNRRRRLREIANELEERFPDCGFRLRIVDE